MTEKMWLAERHCMPCEGGTPPLSHERAEQLLTQLEPGWALESDKLVRRFRFRDFREAIAFVDDLARVAEDEGHHPDLTINYNRVRVELSTHAIGGLSENDFILAAKIELLQPQLVATK